jgi:hypothetical protein
VSEPLIRGGLLGIGCVAALVLAACGRGNDKQSSATVPTRSAPSVVSAIGATRGRTALRRALVSPTAPMPSFAKLPARDLDALVSFLSRLLPDVHGGLRCDRGTDCG